MGLAFDGAEARWSYSGFNRFRSRLVAQLGCDWNKMTGSPFGSVKPDKEANEKFLALEDPITPLIMHSDCEGELAPIECAQVAPRLLELMSKWDADDFDRRQGELLAQGMMRCAEDNKSLKFSGLGRIFRHARKESRVAIVAILTLGVGIA